MLAQANTCKFLAGSSGTADFADGTAVVGFRNLADADLAVGQTYSYRAWIPSFTQWENGLGTWNGTTLERTSQDETSTGSKIDFSQAPYVILTPLKRDFEEKSGTNHRHDASEITFEGGGSPTPRVNDILVALEENKAPKASPTFTGTVTVPDASFSLAKLADLAGVSVPGRSANSSGVMAAITAAANDRLLRRVSDALDFGQLTAGMVPNSILTYAMLASAAIATEAEIKAATASKLLSAAAVWGAADDVLGLTDAATVAVDMSLIMALTSVSIAGNRTWGNPTNVKPGQSWAAAVTASAAIRTIAKGSNYKGTGGATWPLSIGSGETAYVFFYNWSSTIILITGVINNPT